MKATELRIGNWVKYSHLIENVLHEFDSISGIFENNLVSIKSRPYTAFTLDSVNPITLTEEWLLKFGFEEDGHDWYFMSAKDRFTDIGYSYSIKKNVFEVNECEMVEVKYVHQLQNLYFALTGEEL